MAKVLSVTVACSRCGAEHQIHADEEGQIPEGRFWCLRCGYEPPYEIGQKPRYPRGIITLTKSSVMSCIAEAVPMLRVQPNDENAKTCWFYLSVPKYSVEWRRGKGFGLHIHSESDGGFQRPNETFKSIDALLFRLKELTS